MNEESSSSFTSLPSPPSSSSSPSPVRSSNTSLSPVRLPLRSRSRRCKSSVLDRAKESSLASPNDIECSPIDIGGLADDSELTGSGDAAGLPARLTAATSRILDLLASDWWTVLLDGLEDNRRDAQGPYSCSLGACDVRHAYESIQQELDVLQIGDLKNELYCLMQSDRAFEPTSLLACTLMFSLLPSYRKLCCVLEFYEESYIMGVNAEPFITAGEESNDFPFRHAETESYSTRASDDVNETAGVPVKSSEAVDFILDGQDLAPKSPSLDEEPAVIHSVQLPSQRSLEPALDFDDETYVGNRDHNPDTNDEFCDRPSNEKGGMTKPDVLAGFRLSPGKRSPAKRGSHFDVSLDHSVTRIVSCEFQHELKSIIRDDTTGHATKTKGGTRLVIPSEGQNGLCPVHTGLSPSRKEGHGHLAGWYTINLRNGEELSLYCRVAGSSVMVRVGGGWEELGAFLLKWSSRHGSATLTQGCLSSTLARFEDVEDELVDR